MDLIGELLTGWRFRNLNWVHLSLLGTPYLCAPDPPHQLQCHDGLLFIRQEPAVALHGLVVRGLVVDRFVLGFA